MSRALSSRLALGTLVIAALAAAPGAWAAVLTLDSVTTFVAPPTTPVNLTEEGTQDWAYWDTTDTTPATVYAPTNRKNTATPLISDASAFGPDNGGLRGSPNSTTVGRYSFTDGTSLVSDTNRSMASLLFNERLGGLSVGDGFTLQILGTPELEQIVRLYVGGFGDVRANLTLSLNGAETIVDTSQTYLFEAPKNIAVYTLRFRPDSAADTLNVRYTVASQANASAHVGLEAVSVGVIPEPGAALSLLGGAGLLLGLLRRRRN